MATLYAQTTSNDYSNWNDNNSTDDRYAWQFAPTTSGTPTEIVLDLNGISGSPTGNIYISADKTLAATDYGSATGVAFTSGVNTIALTGGAQINSGTTYWVFFVRTTTPATGYPKFKYDTAKTNYQSWRSTAGGIDPNNLWFTSDIKMTINGDLVTESSRSPSGGAAYGSPMFY